MSVMRAKVTWKLLSDRQMVCMHLPALPLKGLPEPLRIHLDLDTESVGGMLQQLTELRMQMLPTPTRN